MRVRYISPFGTPAEMELEVALEHLREDDYRWLKNQEAGALSEHQRQIGPPRIQPIR